MKASTKKDVQPILPPKRYCPSPVEWGSAEEARAMGSHHRFHWSKPWATELVRTYEYMLNIWNRNKEDAREPRQSHQHYSRSVRIMQGLQANTRSNNHRALIIMCPASPWIFWVEHQIGHLRCQMRPRVVEVGFFVLHGGSLKNNSKRLCSSFCCKGI